MEEIQKSSNQSRKKFLIWSVVALSSATFLKFFMGSKKKKTETVKMLTQDGKLVEIDQKLLVSAKNKISDKELQEWIKK